MANNRFLSFDVGRWDRGSRHVGEYGFQHIESSIVQR